MSDSPVLTLGQVAARYGIPTWRVRRLIERGLFPEPLRLGPWRVVPVEQLPALEEALRKAGYLKDAREVAHAG